MERAGRDDASHATSMLAQNTNSSSNSNSNATNAATANSNTFANANTTPITNAKGKQKHGETTQKTTPQHALHAPGKQGESGAGEGDGGTEHEHKPHKESKDTPAPPPPAVPPNQTTGTQLPHVAGVKEAHAQKTQAQGRADETAGQETGRALPMAEKQRACEREAGGGGEEREGEIREDRERAKEWDRGDREREKEEELDRQHRRAGSPKNNADKEHTTNKSPRASSANNGAQNAYGPTHAAHFVPPLASNTFAAGGSQLGGTGAGGGGVCAMPHLRANTQLQFQLTAAASTLGQPGGQSYLQNAANANDTLTSRSMVTNLGAAFHLPPAPAKPSPYLLSFHI